MDTIASQEPDGGHDVAGAGPQSETGNATCPQLTFSEDSGPGSHSPLSLQVLAKQTLIMDSDSDFSDIDFNTFAQRKLSSPKLQHKSKENGSDGSEFYTHGSDGQGKRKWEENGDRSPQSPSKKQKDMYFPEGKEARTEWIKDLSASSGDSALGSSLFNTPLSRLSESSADSNTDTEDSYSPLHSARGDPTVTGTYRKIETSDEPFPPLHFSDDHVPEEFIRLASDADSVRSLTLSNGNEGFVENLILHRLPDENLGMRLSVEGGKQFGHVRKVVVKNVVEDGAAYRASGSSVGICADDEILEVNGTNLRRLTHDECIALFREIPERVHLVVKRAEPPPHRRMTGHEQKDSDVQFLPATEMPELGSLEGFTLQDIIIRKNEGENLGISIVPSYGTTRNFYQIKRLLPSGACAHSGHLHVGDRLLQCNGQLLKGLTQAQCLSALKKGGDILTFRILRQTEGDTSLELSSSITKLDQKNSEEARLCERETERNYIANNNNKDISQKEKPNESFASQPCISEVFAQKNVKLAFTQPFPHQQSSDESDSVTDSSMSSPVKESKDLLGMDSNEQLIDVGGFEIETTPTGQLDNTYLVDTPIVNLETTPRDWETENDGEFDSAILEGHLPPIIEGIPPPMEFADGPPPDIPSAPPDAADQSVPVTNIDDLLGLDDDESTEMPDSNSVQYNGTSFDPLMEFTQTTSTSGGQTSEMVNDLLGDCFSGASTDLISTSDNKMNGLDKQGDHFNQSQAENVTAVENTSIDDFISIGNVTQVPVETGDVEFHSDDTTHVTTRSVNQHIVSKVDISTEDKNLEFSSNTPGSASISVNRTEKVNSAVIELNGNDTKKSTVITINSEKNNKNASPIHFIPPVQSSVKDANGEEIIQPVQMRREKGGVRVFEEGAAASPKQGKKQVDPDAKRDLADILLQLTKSSEQTLKKQDGPPESVQEEDIVPTKISQEEAQTVLSVFEKWLSGSKEEPKPTSVSPFKKMVSNIIDNKTGGKVTKIRVGSDSPLHVLPPVLNEGTSKSGEEEVITPVLMRKDNKGVRSFEPGSSSPSPSYKPRKLDEDAKRDLADILSGLTKSYEETYVKEKPVSSGSVKEEEVVPTKISKEEAKTLMNVFANWMKGDEKPKASPFRKLVSNVIDVLDEPGKEEILTVTKEENKTVIEQKVHTEVRESQSNNVVDSDIMLSSKMISSFAPPKPTARPQNPPDKVPPVPAPKPKSPRGTEKTVETEVVMRKESKVESHREPEVDPRKEPEVVMRPKSTVAPPSPKLSFKSNRFSTGSLPPLNVSKAPPKMAGISLNKSQGKQFSKMPKPEYQKMRREDGPFQVDVLKGIVGLGLKLQARPDGFTQVSEIQKNSPVDKNGQIKVGDYVLSINTTTMTGQSDSRIQQVLRLLPRGLAKIVVSVEPPSESDMPLGSTDSFSSSVEKSGPTSPFGVRLGAKPFNTEESKSATVTSPLLRDSGYFEKRKSSFTQQDKQMEEPTRQVPHVSTIDVSKSVSKKTIDDPKPEDKHVSKINVVKSVEDVKEVVASKSEDVQHLQEDEAQREITTSVKTSVTDTETVNISSTLKTDAAESSKVKEETQVEAILKKDQETNKEPIRPPKPAPRQQVQNLENRDDENEKEAPVNETVPKTSPKIPPKPKTRSSVKEEAPPAQPKFVSNIAVENQPEKTDDPSTEVKKKFVSNIAVEKQAPQQKPENQINKDEVDAKIDVDVKEKPKVVKSPPPVPPKPRRKSSASSDMSSSSVLSDELHYENEVDTGHRRRRLSSNSSELSVGSLKSEKIIEEAYVPRRKNENAPEKRSVKEKMAAFEAFQKSDNESPSRSSNFMTPTRKLSNSSQGQDVHVPRVSDPPQPRTRSSKKTDQEEDGVFIVSRISINSQGSPENNKEQSTTPTSPSSSSPQSPDSKPNLNAALAPKRRTGLSDPKTKPEPGHHHAVPKTSSSIFKPTGLERLKNITGHKKDSGEVAHSSSPEGVYKIGSVKMNSALSPRKSLSEEPASQVGHVFGTAPHKLHSGEGRKILSTSKVAGKKTFFSKYNTDAEPALVKAKFVHISKPPAPDTVIRESDAPSVTAQSSHSVVSSSYVTDHKHVDVSLEIPRNSQDKLHTENTTINNNLESAADEKNDQNEKKKSLDDDDDVVQQKMIESASVTEQGNDIIDTQAEIKEESEVPIIEKETENVLLHTEEIKEQIKVTSSDILIEKAKDSDEPSKVESDLKDMEVEKTIAGNFAEKIVEASLEAAKQELVTEVKQKDSSNDSNQLIFEQNTENMDSNNDVATHTKASEVKSESNNSEKSHENLSNFDKETATTDNNSSDNESLEVSVKTEMVAEENNVDEQELEVNASEIVSLTLNNARKQLENDETSEPMSSSCPSPPALPGTAPPPLPSGPPPPIPSADRELGEAEPPVQATVTEKDTPESDVILPEQSSSLETVPVTVDSEVEAVVKKGSEVSEVLVVKEEDEAEEAAPPLPEGPPPPNPALTDEVQRPQGVAETKCDSDEDNSWVEEIEKVAAKESKFDLLMNFDSKEKVQIDDIQLQIETPTSDTDSGVSVQINSPTTNSAIPNGAEEAPDALTITGISKDSGSFQNSGKLISTSVEPVVDSAVSGEGIAVRKDTEIDSGVESPGEGSNKTVTVQYSSNVSSHEQDSFSSVDSLHDISSSVLSTQTTLQKDLEMNTQEKEKAPVVHASKSKSDSINVSVSQVSRFRESSPDDAPNDFDSSKQLSSSTEKIFSSTPTKECANSKDSAFEVNVSRIQSSSTRLNDSQNISTTSSNVLNKSFSVSPRSKAVSSKRKWKMISCSSDTASDMSVSDLTEVTDSSLVSKEELSELLGQANQRMDKTGLSLEDEIVVVVLKREHPEQELGFELRDGILKSKIVCNLKPGSLAEKDQRLQLKDSLLSVGDKPVEDMTAEEVMKLLAEPSSHVTLVLSRRGSSDVSNGHSITDAGVNGNGVESGSTAKQGPGVFEVVMKKGVTGVGFCLEGGKGSPKGDMPILIKRIFKGGPAEKCGQLQVRDEILKVNECDFTTMRHYEAWNYLKFLPDGDVRILIQRK